jgi:hypothetical protein
MEEEQLKKAYDILWKARENLLKFLVEEILEKEAVLTGKTNFEGAMGFDYQEIDNKYMGRLASLSTFLHNVAPPSLSQPRKPPSMGNRVEVVSAPVGDLGAEINEALKRNPGLKLAGVSMKEGEEGKVTVLLAFTAP